ncbi:uncharacterized protein N7479_000699 [Penicillium vulpinum]|uniref:Uncharacterized protein n=1 Tax=Penicillium vulpinum TaxID=29845 RepID=A0A1V6S665_9EURO|nr:uncharacterized protein N7479_000699 [Penicillium vulpinum]KAJ5970781.1 hypothetical protein N7479_000699 [Penicillium vulpinum]OQE09358.1 hypothetical protein PENVUL_c006G08272 [Penicillium vulpinum]
MTSAIYEITLRNRSGSAQNYVIFNEAPKINDVVSSDIWLNVFQRKMVPNNGAAVFEFSTEYTAVCGAADKAPKNGVTVTVGEPRTVTLGTAENSGKLKTPGSSFLVKIVDGFPVFSEDHIQPGGKINAFEIRTGDIKNSDAVNGNWMIGLGSGGLDGTGLGGPAATFKPQGHKSYQIEPVKKYWISTADYKQGSMIKVAAVADKATLVDFSKRASRSIVLEHGEYGEITPQDE